MKIVHVITRLIIGGAQENTLLTCEGLAARGHDVILLSGPTTGPEGSLVERARGGHYRFEEIAPLVRNVSPLCDLRALHDLRARFEQLRPDVVHTHSSKAGILGRIAAHLAGVPIIVHTIHGRSFNRTQPRPVQLLYATAERLCADYCQKIVSVADAMTEQSLDACIGHAEQYTTIRSGMVVADFNPAMHDAAECRRALLPKELHERADELCIVATIARLFPNKGYEQLIDVIERAVPHAPDLHFLCVGGGSHRAHYEAELSRRGLRQHVTFTGLIPPADIPRVLAGIDLLAHTSQWEGLPRAVVQALLMEKPAVSFAVDGAPEVVIPGVTGELAPLGDTNAFADALVQLAHAPTLRRRYGTAGRRRCIIEFDHNVMVDRIEGMYQRIKVE
ncbi:MAG: glycosyltransferase family 4 protein [Planctomycetes bacterium]|nr:glycosyltransferase family 4 protein [Planctomycetota bacterium]